MNVLKFKLPAEVVFGDSKVIFVSSSSIHEYIEDKKTDKVIGTTYTVVCPKSNYQQAKVKTADIIPVLTTDDAISSDEPIIVSFEDFVGSIYYDQNGKAQVSCRASKIIVH